MNISNEKQCKMIIISIIMRNLSYNKSLKMNINNLKVRTPYILSALILPAHVAIAENIADETMVVTATAGKEKNLLEAPATMTLIDSQEQSKYQMTGDVGDLLVDVPGVNISTQANGSRSIRIRGLSNDYTQVLLNGRRSYTKEALWRGSDSALSLTPTVAVDRVEVIRGPMSTLYGADTMGGVVNVITRKHNGAAEGAMSVEGQYNQGDRGGNGQVYGLYYSMPVNDALSYTVYGNYLDIAESFYADYPDATKRRAQENYNLVNTFDLAINDQHSLALDIQLSNEEQLGTAMFNNRYYEQQRRLQSYTLGYGYQSSRLNIDANLYYSDFDVQYDLLTSNSTEHNYGGDAKAILSFNQYDITFGTETRNAKVDNISFKGGSADRKSSAAYVESNHALTDATTLTLGGRYDHDSLFGSEFTYRGYLTQGVAENWSMKAGVGTAFKAPSLAQISPYYAAPGCGGRCNIYGNSALKAETGTFSELGMYYTNGTTLASATVFYNQVDDIIQQAKKKNGDYTFVNIDKATLKGLELSATHQWEYIGLDASYTYLDAKDDYSGDRLVGTSEHEASLKATWYANYALNIFTRLHYRSEVRGELGNNDVSDPYTTLDLGMSYDLANGVALKMGVNNLMNKDVSSPDTYTEVIQGRTYYTGINYEF
ncbi:TonB-dependent receptor domain-containing protein [Aeromonas sp. 601019]